jgi:hypothetical protein
MSLDSVPRQRTLVNQIFPTPLVKPEVRATASAGNDTRSQDFSIPECPPPPN